jgi:hypothetical protein
MDIIASRERLVTVLKTAELDGDQLRVAEDLGNVNAPCAYVALQELDVYLAGGEATWRVYLVAEYSDQVRVLEQLQKLLDAVTEIGIAPAAPIEYVALPTPESSTALPALLIRITDEV